MTRGSASSIAAAFSPYRGDLLRIGTNRRGFLQAGLAGLAGVSVPDLLRRRAVAATPARGTSVILFWLSGGPSHIDMWDPKPDAPAEIRGPFGAIPTAVGGIRVCEHLPLTAGLMDRLTIIRSVDCTASNHTPITLQAGNALARRTDNGRDGDGWPSMGSVAARFRGPNAADMPPYVALADSLPADVWGAGQLGPAFEPVDGKDLVGRLQLQAGVSVERLADRRGLMRNLDRLEHWLDSSGALAAADRATHQAYGMLLGGAARRAFDLDAEPAATRDRYGRDSLGEKALLARRLVEAGSTFVTVSGAWGYFDHHGDDVRWGGIEKGLRPLLPAVDRTLHAIVTDLDERGLLDTTLVLMLGEFGRAPVINRQAGRDHWTNVMSMVVAGGGLRHGQVIGGTDDRGHSIASRRVAPADLAATVFHHFGIDGGETWTDLQGRPRHIVTDGGQVIRELV